MRKIAAGVVALAVVAVLLVSMRSSSGDATDALDASEARSPRVDGSTFVQQLDLKAEAARLRHLYLMSIKKSIRNFLYRGPTYSIEYFAADSPFSQPGNEDAYKEWTADYMYKYESHSLACHNCIELTQRIIESILESDIPGDVAELGVFRGGMSVWMKALLTAHGDKKRRVWLFDTYAGIPKSVKKSSSSEEVDNWSNRHMATKNQVRSVFMRYGLLDTNVKFVRGTFHDTLSTQAPRKYSLIRFDGDTYESTVDALELAYSRLADGGYFIVDDWHLAGCRQAILEYRAKFKIDDKIIQVQGGGQWREKLKNAFWKKGSGPDYKGFPEWPAQVFVDEPTSEAAGSGSGSGTSADSRKSVERSVTEKSALTKT